MELPPFALWLNIHQDIVAWCLGPGIGCRGSRLIRTSANGAPAWGQYKPAPDGAWESWSLQVLEARDGKISGLTSSSTPPAGSPSSAFRHAWIL